MTQLPALRISPLFQWLRGDPQFEKIAAAVEAKRAEHNAVIRAQLEAADAAALFRASHESL